MVFSCAFCVGAEDSSSMKAYQDGNGDLIISGPEEDIAKLMEGYVESENGVTGTHTIYAEQTEYGYWGMIQNVVRKYGEETYDDRVFEQVDKTTLRITKATLLDSGFVNGTYELRLRKDNSGNDVYFENSVKLDLGKEAKPNQVKELELIGSVPKVVVGESTKVTKEAFALKAVNGDYVSADDYSFAWTEKSEWEGKTVYIETDDETFQAGKEYFLRVYYRYTENNKTDIRSEDISLKHSNFIFKNTTSFFGATMGTYLSTRSSASFLCSNIITEAPVATKNANDVVKTVVNGETKAWMAFNLTSVTADAKPEVIELIKADKVKPSVSAPKEEEKSLSFEVKPVDDQGNEVDTKGIWVTFSVNVGEKFEEGTKVNVLHYHDGEDEAVETLVGVVDGSGDVVLSTNMGFSTFKVVEAPVTAIVPETAPEAPAPAAPTQAGPKDTNADGVISCEEEMGSKNWVWSDSKKACVYKVTNTSTK